MTPLQYLLYLIWRLLFPTSTRTMEWHMLRLLNKDRKKHGLSALFMQEDLREVARKHSRDMARQDYFSHTNLKGQSPGDRLKGARVTDATAGENLAKIGGFALPTQRAEIGLMLSPGHRANILNEHYNCVGIGVIKSITRVYYFTQNFAKREVILHRKPRTKVRQKKGLVLKGRTVNDLGEILIEIQTTGEKPQRMLVPVQKQKFMAHLAFTNPGHHTLKLYTPRGRQYHLVNQFEIRVV